jgi:hypothetical protein
MINLSAKEVYDGIPTCAARELSLRHKKCLLLIDRFFKEYPIFLPLFTLIREQLVKAENKSKKL